MKQPKRLTCCCCGESTLGRQWWNRDTGFGLCDGCIAFVGIKPDDITTSSYGIRGYHFDLKFDPKYVPDYQI